MSNRKLPPAAFCAVALALWATSALSQSTQQSVRLAMDDGAVASASIQLQRIERSGSAPELRFPATVTTPANRIRAISAPVEGLIEELFVLSDEKVAQGQAVATIRSPGMVEAQRSFLAAIDDLRLADDQLRRYTSLIATKAVAEREFREAQGAASLAKSKLDERRYILRLMDMSDQQIGELESSRKLVSAMTLRSPVAGTVIKRHVNPGERIAAAAALYSVADLSNLFVNIQVPSHSISLLPVSGKVVLPALEVSGRIVRAAPTINEATQSGTVVAEVENNNGRLRPGLAVTALIESGAQTASWMVPPGAVVRHRERSWIFVRTAGGFEARIAEVVAENGRATYINADVTESDQIAVRGTILLLGQLAMADGT